MKRKITTQKVRKEIYDLVGDEYEMLSNYTGSANLITIKHNICGNTFEVTAGSFLYAIRHGKHPCRFCSNNASLSKEEVKEKIKEQCGEEYEMIGAFNGYSNHVLMRHNKCGKIWQVIPEIFLKKRTRCPWCSGQIIDREKAQSILDEKCNNAFEIIEYTHFNRPAKIKRRSTGEIINVTKLRCVVTGGEKYISKPRGKKKPLPPVDHVAFEKQYPDFSFKWLTRYKAKMTCKKCGTEIIKNLKNSKNITCEKCNPKLPTKGTEEYFKKCLKENGDFYELISPYKNSSTPASFIHKKCGTKFTCRPGYLIFCVRHEKENAPCPKCQGVKGIKKTNEEFQNDIDQKFGKNVYTLISEYRGRDKPVVVKHSCGHIYEVTPDTLLLKNTDQGCPACAPQSKGQEIIKKFLKKKKIDFKTEHCFKELKDVHYLRFDFIIFDSNKDIILAIEFDGRQHYDAVKHWGGESYLKKLQEHDKMKDEYCKSNNIPLLRIPYWEEENIEGILENSLKKYNIL